MLTKEAFNALLKTLEEPPKHVVFILATTEIEKLPETIISRCQTFIFNKPNTAILKKMVQSVAKKEGYTLEPTSAELLALLASGSYRDAHGYLQQAIAVSKDKIISASEVEAVTGAPRSEQLIKLIDAIGDGDLDTSLMTVHTLVTSGTDTKTMLILLTRLVRAILLFRSAPSMRKEIEAEFSPEDFDSIKRHSGVSQVHINSKLLLLLLDVQIRLGTTYTFELPLELALIEHLNKTP
jgi:DNA polymerase-3 subunit gamma/tau